MTRLLTGVTAACTDARQTWLACLTTTPVHMTQASRARSAALHTLRDILLYTRQHMHTHGINPRRSHEIKPPGSLQRQMAGPGLVVGALAQVRELLIGMLVQAAEAGAQHDWDLRTRARAGSEPTS